MNVQIKYMFSMINGMQSESMGSAYLIRSGTLTISEMAPSKLLALTPTVHISMMAMGV